jgi:hypothetical protein
MSSHINKAGKYISTLLCCVCVFMSNSCQRNPSSLDKAQSYEQTPISFVQPTITADVNKMTPTPTDIGKSSTDILFEAKVNNPSCNTVEEPFEVILSFTNLTTSPLRIADQFLIAKNRRGSGGNISPVITFNGQDIYNLWDNSMGDIPYPCPDTYFEIQPGETLNKTIKYSFPRELLEGWPSLQEIIVTPTPGSYSIRFGYIQVQRPFDSWHGFVKSNQVEICLTTDE